MKLDPHASTSWRGFLDLLRPPAGYRVASACGTTYGLSFDALVAALLAMLDTDAEELARDPVACVMAVTRLAPRVRILFHPATIQGPAERLPAHLINMLDRVLAPIAIHSGLFHPKVWVLRFERIDRPELSRLPAESGRVVVSSRNLTRSRAFEIGAVFDGDVSDRPTAFAQDVARALETWIRSSGIHNLAIRSLPAFVGSLAIDAPDEARDGLRLRWQGLGAQSLADSLPQWLGRAVVVSPFLRRDFLQILLDRTEQLRIVSTPEALSALDEGTFRQLEERAQTQGTTALFAIDTRDFPDEDGEAALDGIHAKLLVVGDGEHAMTLVGSANATGPGWGVAGANVEAMVELRPGLGINAFVRGFLLDDKKRPHRWVRQFQRDDRVVQSDEERIEEELRRALRRLDTVNLEVSYAAQERRLCVRRSGRTLPRIEVEGPDLVLDLAPLARSHLDGAWQPLSALDGGALFFEDFDLADVGAFVAIRARRAGIERMRILLGRLQLSDEAVDRRDDAARASLLATARPEDILRALVLGLPHLPRTRSGSGASTGTASFARLLEEITLERMLEAVAQDPTLIRELRLLLGPRLDAGFARFCDDIEAALHATSEGSS